MLARTFPRSALFAQSVGTGLGNGADALRAVGLLDGLTTVLAMDWLVVAVARVVVEAVVLDGIPGSLGFSPVGVLSSEVVLGVAAAAVVVLVADGAIKRRSRGSERVRREGSKDVGGEHDVIEG